MDRIKIERYSEDWRQEVLSLTIRAWDPVFRLMEEDVPSFVFEAFYPDGWRKRQSKDVADLLDKMGDSVWLATKDKALVGFMGLTFHPEDKMSEIGIIAVDPRHQREGIAKKLMTFAEQQSREAGAVMIMVETVGDRGHSPARKSYEASGYEPWPVARYFKSIK